MSPAVMVRRVVEVANREVAWAFPRRRRGRWSHGLLIVALVAGWVLWWALYL